MGQRAVAAATAGLLVARFVAAETPHPVPLGSGANPPPAAPAATTPGPSASPAPRASRLKLGALANPYAPVDDATLAELLRFEQHIEVEGRAPRDLDTAMAEWWDHFNFQY